MGIPEETHLEIVLQDVEGLRQSGHTVETIEYGGKKSKRGFWGRISVVISNAWKLKSRIRLGVYDIVHLNSAFDSNALLRDAVTLFMLRNSKPKIFLKFHGSDLNVFESKSNLMRWLTRQLARQVDGFGVLSTEEKSNFIAGGYSADKLFVVKNIVDSSSYVREKSFRKSLGINDDCTILLFTGRFMASKGILDVIESCGLLVKRGIDFVLLLLGDGILFDEATKKVAELGIERNVKFLGFIQETSTKPYYANSNILVFPTYHQEGFPMTVFQAVAAGLPIITTRIRAAADYLKEPDNCLWVEARNPVQLAEKIQYLISHPELRAHMGKNNRILAAQFCTDKVVARYCEIYEELMAS